MQGLQIVVQLVGTDMDGTPKMVQETLMLNPEGPASASSGPIHLPAGVYRIDVLAPAAPVVPEPVTAASIVDELARRLAEREPAWDDD